MKKAMFGLVILSLFFVFILSGCASLSPSGDKDLAGKATGKTKINKVIEIKNNQIKDIDIEIVDFRNKDTGINRAFYDLLGKDLLKLIQNHLDLTNLRFNNLNCLISGGSDVVGGKFLKIHN